MMRQLREQSQDCVDTKSSVILLLPVPQTDTGLVASLRALHPGAVRALCERYSGELLKVASRILGPDPRIDSIAVATLRWSLAHLDELAEPQSLRLWLLSRLVVLVERRIRAKRWLRWLGGTRNAVAFGHYNWTQQQASTYRLLDRIDVDSRMAFCLVTIHSMGLAEAAIVLGTSRCALQDKLAEAHAQFDRLIRSKAPGLSRRHSSHAALGVEIAKEQDARRGCGQIFEFDLLQSGDRLRWCSLFCSWRLAWVLALAPVLVVLVSVVTISITYFRPVQFSVSGGAATSSTASRLGYWVVAPQSQSETVSFSDGSSLALAPGSRLRVLRTNYRGSSCVLDSGTAALSVMDSGRAEYLLAAGPFVVQIDKGQAEFSWDANQELLDITVHRGGVVISGCQFQKGNAIFAGTAFQARCRSH